MDNRDEQILNKIILYCQRIESNLQRFDDDKEKFFSDYLFQDACCMCIVQIGELAGLLTEESKSLNKSIPWRAVKDTRNLYVHAYGSINPEMVWNTMHTDIPELEKACEEMLQHG